MVIHINFPQQREIAFADFHNELNSFATQPRAIRDLTWEQIAETLFGLSKRLLQRDHPLHQLYRHQGLPFLIAFLAPSQLRQLMRLSLRDEKILDEMVMIHGVQCLARPVGVVGHWLAGNIPLLSLISLIQAWATKNMSVVKLSSGQEDFLTPVLYELAELGEVGKILAGSVRVYAFPRSLQQAHDAMGAMCDVRLAWGGLDAVESVQKLPYKDFSAQTIAMGPKFSLCVIDTELMDDLAYRSLAQDISLFNQEGCSSPHAILILGDTSEAVRKLSVALDEIKNAEYFVHLEPHQASRVLNYRVLQAMQGEKLFCSQGTEWTIHVHDCLETLHGEGNRIIHFYGIDNFDFASVVPHLPESLQTVSHRLSEGVLANLVHTWKYTGVDRFPKIGHAHEYNLPWDGMMILDRLVQWIRIN